MKIVDFTMEWVSRALELLAQNYEEERAEVNCLPKSTEMPELSVFAENGMGVAAVENDVSHWLDAREKEPPRMFAAIRKGKPAGYLEVVPEGQNGENYISWQKNIWNICGAYCAPEERGRQVAAGLLRFLENTLAREGASFLGVDCETINPTALGFWPKHFTSYTLSVVRRIDENYLIL